MDKIKIAEVIGDAKTGGIISCLMNFYRHIDKEKFQIDFYTNNESPYDEEIMSLGGRVFYYPKVTSLMKNISSLTKAFKEENYDIVHAHQSTLSVFTLKAAKKANIPIRICHSHSTTNPKENIRYIIKNLLKPFAKTYATDLCACSQLSADWLYGKDNNAFILHNAIDLDKFNKQNIDIDQIKEELNIQGKKVVGFVGRLETQKNVPYLVEIFNKLASIRSDIVLLIVGSGSKLPIIKDLINKYNLNDKVLLMPDTNMVQNYYAIMDVFCLPSLYEGLPLVAVESQAMLVPSLLSTNISNEVNLTNYVKFLPIDNIDSWVTSINEMLDNKIDNIISLKNSCYDINYETKKLENYYESLIRK